jgi:hypothetical protein
MQLVLPSPRVMIASESQDAVRTRVGAANAVLADHVAIAI